MGVLFNPKLLLALFAFYFFLIAVAVFSFSYSHFCHYSCDFALHAQAFWNAVQGKGFYSTLEGGSHLGRHFTPIHYGLLLFYSLSPSAYTLNILNIIIFCLSVFPLYGILKPLFGEKPAFLFILLFYLSPVVYSIPEGPFRDTSILPFFFLSAFYFYKKEKFAPFMIFLLLCNATKEIVALPMALFGFVALLEKRSWKWVLSPFVVSVAWFWVAVKWVMPLFISSSLGHEWKVHLGYLGGNFKEILGNMIRFDFLNEHIFFKRKAVYFFRMALPFGIFVPFLSIYWIFAIPDAAGIFFSTDLGTTSFTKTYGIIIHMAFFLGFVDVVHRYRLLEKKWVARILPKAMPFVFSCFIIFPAINLFLTVSEIHLKFNSKDIFSIKVEKISTVAHRNIVNLIPPEASVSAPPIIANHLTDRETLHLKISYEATYLVLNESERTPEVQKQLAENSYQDIFSENDWTLYKRGSATRSLP